MDYRVPYIGMKLLKVDELTITQQINAIQNKRFNGSRKFLGNFSQCMNTPITAMPKLPTALGRITVETATI
jgi:hypothetical protein